MGAATQLDLFCAFCIKPCGWCRPSRDAQASTPTAAEREVSEEFDGERDLGSLDLPEDLGDWKEDYANAVGISSWREL